jgi:hypothetical protein
LAKIKVSGEADAGVAHTQGHLPSVSPEPDGDITGVTIGKGVFQGVGEELVEDEAAGNGGIDIENQLIKLSM